MKCHVLKISEFVMIRSYSLVKVFRRTYVRTYIHKKIVPCGVMFLKYFKIRFYSQVQLSTFNSSYVRKFKQLYDSNKLNHKVSRK